MDPDPVELCGRHNVIFPEQDPHPEPADLNISRYSKYVNESQAPVPSTLQNYVQHFELEYAFFSSFKGNWKYRHH